MVWARAHTAKPFFCLAIAIAICGSACSVQRQDTAPLSVLSGINQLAADSQLSLFAVDSHLDDSAYLGTMQRTAAGFELPEALREHIKTRNTAQAVSYVVRAYSPTATGSDYFFETPVLSETLEFSGATSALWLALKKSAQASGRTLLLTRDVWEDLLFELETACEQSPVVTAKQAWAALVGKSDVQARIQGLLRQVDTAAEFRGSVLAAAPLVLAWSDPPVLNNMGDSQNTEENSALIFKSVFYSPDRSDERLLPDWFHTRPDSETTLVLSADWQASVPFDFLSEGQNAVIATKTIADGRTTSVTFPVSVGHVNQQPVWSAISDQNLQANHRLQLDLASFGTDLDNDILTFSLVSAPTGVTVIGSILQWNPTQLPDGADQIGEHQITLRVTDVDGATATTTFRANVVADHLPSFAPAAPSTWSVIEGVSNHLDLVTAEADQDAIALVCVSGCSTLVSGDPEGAGWPETYSYLGSVGAETGRVTYLPSFREVIGSASENRDVVLGVYYNVVAAPQLRQITPVEHSVTLTVNNADDPPVWTGGSTSVPESHSGAGTLAENTSFVSTATYLAEDPAPNSSGLTYSLNTPPNNCTWLVLDTVNRKLQSTGTIPYSSAGVCEVTIRATDASGLFTDSPPISLEITDMNRVPSAGTAIGPKTVNEGQTLTIDLNSYFTDPDKAVNDPRENFVFSCTANCPAGLTISENTLSYTPSYAVSSGADVVLSNVTIQVTDKGGATASQTFSITVKQAEGPVGIAVSAGTLAFIANKATVTENDASGTLIVAITQQPGDSYSYGLSTSCGSCSSSLLALPVAAGSGTANYALTITPSYTDGDGGPGFNWKNHTVTVTVTKDGGTLPATQTFSLTVNNSNRLPTGISIDGNSTGATYEFTVDGSTWNSNYKTLSAVDLDGINDSYTYNFYTNNLAAVGTLSSNRWSFNPIQAGCGTGEGTVTKEFEIKVSDGRGGTSVRRMRMIVTNAQEGAGGSCPY